MRALEATETELDRPVTSVWHNPGLWAASGRTLTGAFDNFVPDNASPCGNPKDNPILIAVEPFES